MRRARRFRRREESRWNAWGSEKKLRLPSHHLTAQPGLLGEQDAQSKELKLREGRAEERQTAWAQPGRMTWSRGSEGAEDPKRGKGRKEPN